MVDDDSIVIAKGVGLSVEKFPVSGAIERPRSKNSTNKPHSSADFISGG